MKKLVAVTAFALAVLMLVAFVRAARFPSKQVPVEARTPETVHGARAVSHLSEAVRYKTVSHENPAENDPAEFLRFHEFLARAYPKTHAVLSRETVNRLSLLYTWKGTREDLTPALLMGHYDVVPVEPGTEGRWTKAPFDGSVSDGYVWGRGTLDDKSAVIAIFESVETLLEKAFTPERTMYLAFGHDEEVGGAEGAARVAALLESRGVKLDYVIDEGGAIVEESFPGFARAVAVVGTSEKGYLNVELSVEAEGGHSSAPPRSTAIGVLARAIVRLEDHPLPGAIRGTLRETLETIGAEMSFLPRLALANLWLTRPLIERTMARSPEKDATLRTTTAATIFAGGVKANVLPGEARAVVNFRIHPEDRVQTVLDHITGVIDDERVRIAHVPGQAREPSPVSPSHGLAFERIARTTRELWPEVVVAPYVVPGGTDARNFTGLSKNVYRFSPLRVTPADLRRAHGTDERIRTKNLEELVHFFVRLIRSSA